MILGVEHIALSCNDVVQGAQLLNDAGFKVKFVETDVTNDPSKRSLLNSFRPLHSIAYCQASGGIALELTQHAHQLDDSFSPYQVLLSRSPGNTVPFKGPIWSSWQTVWRATLECGQPQTEVWQPFHAQFWYDASENVRLQGEVFVRALIVPVSRLSVSEAFWVKGLGCSVRARGVSENICKWTRMAIQSPVPTWALEIALVETEQRATHPCLDDPGFPCLAVITNRMDEDLDALVAAGGHIASEVFSIEVGGKILGVALLRGPDNELVELIEFRHT